MDILINDENVASDHKFRILNAGMDLTRYKANNQILYFHNDQLLAIGNVENVRIEGSKMFGTVKWDNEDEDAETKRIIKKYESGVMKGWSVGILPIEFVDLKPNEGGDLVAMKSELYEISLVTLQSNRASVTVKLMNEVELMKLGHSKDGHFEINKILIHSKNSDMKKVLAALGMDDNSTEDQVVERINKMKSEQLNLQAAMVADLVKQAIAKGLTTETNKENFKNLATASYEAAKGLVDGFVATPNPKGEQGEQGAAAPTNLTEVLTRLAANAQTTEGSPKSESDADKYLRLGSEDKLDALEQSNPTEFKKLESAYVAQLNASRRRR
jgi:hypothetical protein